MHVQPKICPSFACAAKCIFEYMKDGNANSPSFLDNSKCSGCDGRDFKCGSYTFVFSETGKGMLARYAPCMLIEM